MKTAHYQTELANKIRNGRAVGSEYVVTQSGISTDEVPSEEWPNE